MVETVTRTKAEAFVAHLRELADAKDRAALAALRRGLGKSPGEAPEMFPHLVPWLPAEPRPAEEEAYYLVAALFALHPASWGDGEARWWERSFGASMARLKQATESEGPERRFVGLLTCDREDLPEHLRRAVALLKASEIPVDWGQLLRDVQRWERPDRSVQRAWARAFWGVREIGGESDGNEEEDEEDTTD